MATIRKRGSKYQAIVRRAGYAHQARSFDKYQDARDWAAQREAEATRGELQDYRAAGRLSFSDALREYEEVHLSTSKHPKKLRSQLKVLGQSSLAGLSVKNVNPRSIAQFRDERLKQVSPASAVKDINKISAVFTWLINERFLQLPLGNPVKQVNKPRVDAKASRNRRLTADEEAGLRGYFFKHNQQMLHLFNLALSTGMRRGELVSIKIEDVDWNRGTLQIPETKNGHARDIPLSDDAYQAIYGWYQETLKHRQTEVRLFNYKADSVTQAFNRACKKLEIEDLRWHDLRHEAISRLFESGKLDWMEVAHISGHKDLSMLKRYTHLKAEKIREKLQGNTGYFVAPKLKT